MKESYEEQLAIDFGHKPYAGRYALNGGALAGYRHRKHTYLCMQSTPSEPSTETTIIRTGSDGRLRYTAGQRQELLEAFDRSGVSAMAGVSPWISISRPVRSNQEFY